MEEQGKTEASLDFPMARLAHRTWKLKLRAFLDDEQRLTEAEIISPSDCALGRWLSHVGLKKYGRYSEIAQLNTIHTEMHMRARKLFNLKVSGGVQLAEQEYERVVVLSAQIIDLLTVIERKIGR